MAHMRLKVGMRVNAEDSNYSVTTTRGKITEVFTRGCDVLLDGESRPLYFLNEEITILEEDEEMGLTQSTNKPVFTREQAEAFERYTELCDRYPVSSFEREKGTFNSIFKSLNGVNIDDFARAVYCGYELEDTTERDYWASMGREIGEFRHGDIFINALGLNVEGTPEDGRRMYEEGDFNGLYPAESYKPYGKDAR